MRTNTLDKLYYLSLIHVGMKPLSERDGNFETENLKALKIFASRNEATL